MSEPVAATLVLPTRNEHETIGPFLGELRDALAGTGQRYEVLVVDDSDDNRTISEVDRAVKELWPFGLDVRHHHRPPNERSGGLSGAMIEGLRRAQSDVVVFKDGDGQHPPHVAPELIAQLDEGKQIVVGSRYRKGGSAKGLDGWLRHAVSRGATAVTKLLFPRGLRGVTDPMSGCFAVRRDQLDLDELRPRGFKFLLELLAHHPHLERSEVPLQFRPRAAGESKAGEGNGTAFLKQLPSLRLRTLPSFVKFAFGGALIALLGVLMLEGLVRAGVTPVAANAVQLATTLGLSFLYSGYLWRHQAKKTLPRRAVWFGLTRGTTMVLSWLWFIALLGEGLHHQLANIICLSGGTVLNYLSSKYLVFCSPIRPRRVPWLGLTTLVSANALLAITVINLGVRSTLIVLLVSYALFSLVTSGLEVQWRLFGRRTPEARQQMRFPDPVRPEKASISFSLVVLALDEAQVLADTLRNLAQQVHPHIEIIASLVKGDTATIVAAETVAAETDRVRVLVCDYGGKNHKAKQLNEALKVCKGDYVVPFDAEDDVHPELLLHVEALIDQTNADVVVGGVQLVNLDLAIQQDAHWLAKQWIKLRGWFCVHNVLEYYFWFSSRMFYQIKQQLVPLPGNTVCIRREKVEAAGGWPVSPTEDCALGVKLSVEYDVKVVAAYDPRLATREETPSHIFGRGGLDPQRQRWDLGFLLELLKQLWLQLPTLRQRMMAAYILGMPFIQAFNAILLPLFTTAFFMLSGPVGLVLIMFTPFIPIIMSIMLQVTGLGEFSRDFEVKARLRHYLSVMFMAYPYQLLLGYSAVMAIKRLIKRQFEWTKTSHSGLHRPLVTPTVSTDAVDDDIKREVTA